MLLDWATEHRNTGVLGSLHTEAKVRGRDFNPSSTCLLSSVFIGVCRLRRVLRKTWNRDPVPVMDETNCQCLDICTIGIYFVYEDICLGRGEKEFIIYHGFSPDTVVYGGERDRGQTGRNKSVQMVAL